MLAIQWVSVPKMQVSYMLKILLPEKLEGFQEVCLSRILEDSELKGTYKDLG